MSESVTLLIVDDSRLFRSAVEEALRDQPGVKVVGSVFSGAKALEFIRATPPDLVTLDVEMPGMDGLQTLEEIQAFNRSRPSSPPVSIVMLSAFTQKGEQVTIKALQAGAFDFVAKPSTRSAEASLAELRSELLAKIGALRISRARSRGGQPGDATPKARTRTIHKSRPRAVVIGASTGGPRALSEMLPLLCETVELPILVVQHMPTDFTRTFAESLARQTRRRAIEASDGQPLENSTIYVAPGGKHMLVRGSALAAVAGLNELPRENGCRPSADVLFRSAAGVFGPDIVAIILTGMGRDGTAGLGAVHRAGGYVVAQDEASSVVWGMPGSAVEAGVVDEVRPLTGIPQAVSSFIHRITPS